MNITLYHNPNCSTSRKVLELIRAKGIEPEVIEYLITPLSRTKLVELMKKMDVPIQELIRLKEALFSKMNLDDRGITDDNLLDAIALHPVLMNRPIVVTKDGAYLCRPAEKILDILPK
jgi:arsenate reductase